MKSHHAVAAAVAAAAGALHATDLPAWPLLAALGVAVALRRPWLVVAIVMVASSARADDAWQSIEAPVEPAIEGTASLVRDPVRNGVATTVLVEIDDRRFVASAYGPAGARLARLAAGDQVAVAGSTRPWTGSVERRAALHAAHRLDIASVGAREPTPPLWSIANALRSRIERGAASLDDARRGLFTGLVYGDDRSQSALVEADFRLAGLTHLLAVSGQNVAYLLVLLGPVLRRCGLGWRWALTVAALVVFATATRYEPSVLRATAMAGIAATGALTGHASTSLRNLAFAVVVLIVFDPLLAHTIAFRLSVAASAGIIVLQTPIAARLGNGTIADALAVTLSAQVAVAPLLVTTFGPISIVSIPANLLAGPVAGVAMGWGMTAGLVAGVVGGPVATAVHTCTTPMLWWLEQVAHAAASVPLAPVGLVWIGTAVSAWLVAGGVLRVPASPFVVAVAAVVLVAGLGVDRPDGRVDVGPGSHLVALDDTVVLVVDGRIDPVWLLEDLRRVGVRHVSLLIGAAGRADIDAVLARLGVERWWAVDEWSSVSLGGAATGPWFPLDGLMARLVRVDEALSVELAPP